MTTGSGFTGEFTQPGCSVDSEAGRARDQITGEHRSGLPGLAALAAGVWTLYILASHRARRRSTPGESEAAAAAAEPLRRQGPGGRRRERGTQAAFTESPQKSSPRPAGGANPPGPAPQEPRRATAGQRRPGGPTGRSGREDGPKQSHRATTPAQRAGTTPPTATGRTKRTTRTGPGDSKSGPWARHHRRLRRPVEPNPAAGGSDAGHRTAEEPPPGRPEHDPARHEPGT